jgi:light-regulated signal transduction histidine kinase (bacteriophytochrome)
MSHHSVLNADAALDQTNSEQTPAVDQWPIKACLQDPIHIPGSIQPHGSLMIVDAATFTIVQVSANTETFLGYAPRDLVNQPLETIIGLTYQQEIQGCLDQDFSAINPIRIQLDHKELNLVVHENQGNIFLEFEPIDPIYNNNFMTFYNMTKKVVDQMQLSKNLQDLSEIIVENIRKLTGFDRVMVYRFDPDGSGHVIAEDKLESLDSFYGLRYPAIDIPEPARRLFELNYTRLIPTLDHERIPLPHHPITGEPFDLSYCNLRSVSPCHVQYLKNMGVQASLLISLMQESRLWGLVACHHYQPKYLPYEIRVACEFLAKVMSLNLIAKADQEDLNYKVSLRDRLSRLFENLSQDSDVTDGLEHCLSDLQTIVEAGGVALCLNGNILVSGCTPSLPQIMDLIKELRNQHNVDLLFYCDRLGELYPPAQAFQTEASGVLMLSLSRVENSYILWFRPEVSQTVCWAGNPQEDVTVGADGTLTLSPRKSFELWKQTVMGRSLPWLSCEIQQVMEFRNLLVDVLFKKSNELLELNSELKRSNDELDSFAYIASHDLKEPLRGIYNYSYILLEDYQTSLDEDGNLRLQTLMSLAKRMEKLIDALLHYSRIGRQDLACQRIDLEKLVLMIIRPILEASYQETIDIQIENPLPLCLGDKTLIEEVFLNLISNGIKYNAKQNKSIRVGSLSNPKKSAVPIYYVRDNGIGISTEHQTLIFRIFKRLHSPKQYGGGTGAGLTIVKKIVERHGGRIWVDSAVGEGTTFYFTLADDTP